MKRILVTLLALLCVLLAVLAALSLRAQQSAPSEPDAAEPAAPEAVSAESDALRAELESARQEAVALRGENEALSGENEALSGEIARLSDANAALEAELAAPPLSEMILQNRSLTERTLRTAHLDAFRYLLYTPGVTSDEPLPLILFLHGSGGCGTKLEDIYSDDTLPTMLKNGWLSPNAIVVMPQCPTSSWDPYIGDLMELLEAVIGELGADRARISVTGFSLGAMACFELLTRWPDYFSAALPISAWCDPAACSVITTTPVRIFHGERDAVMNITYMIEADKVINAAGGQSTLTVFPGEDHFVQQHYLDELGEPVEWLISQRRADK